MSFQPRHNFGIVEIDGMLYILGGEDGEKELISMECYDIYSKTWTKQPDLTMVRKVRTISCHYKLGFKVSVFSLPHKPLSTIDSVERMEVVEFCRCRGACRHCHQPYSRTGDGVCVRAHPDGGLCTAPPCHARAWQTLGERTHLGSSQVF